MAYESFASQVTILWQSDLQLLSQTLNNGHVNVCKVVVSDCWRHLLMVASLAHHSLIQVALIVVAEELALATSLVLILRLWLRLRYHEGLALLQKGLNRELVDQSNHLVDRVLLMDLLFLDHDRDLWLSFVDYAEHIATSCCCLLYLVR